MKRLLPWIRYSLRGLLALVAMAGTLIIVGACALAAATQPSCTNCTNNAGVPTSDPFNEVDNALAQAVEASIAYNAPHTMKLDQATTIKLLMNPSLTPTALATQVSQSGQVVTATIDITPLMKAELLPSDPAAFTIQPLQDNSVQLISSKDTTSWEWSVTPEKGGPQTLTLVIYRQVKFQGQDYWRSVKSYEANIDVQVTFGQRLAAVDWKWVLGIVVPLVAIPAFWRWYDRRKKKRAAPKAHAHTKSGK